MVLRRILLALLTVSGLSACGFPAGAPIQAEILAEAKAKDPTFEVVDVTRANLPKVLQSGF